MIIVYSVALYALVGLVIAVAFVWFGITRVIPQSMTVTTGARLALLPGAAALWPYMLVRWLMSGGRR
jgi:hypothetical protein